MSTPTGLGLGLVRGVAMYLSAIVNNQAAMLPPDVVLLIAFDFSDFFENFIRVSARCRGFIDPCGEQAP